MSSPIVLSSRLGRPSVRAEVMASVIMLQVLHVSSQNQNVDAGRHLLFAILYSWFMDRL